MYGFGTNVTTDMVGTTASPSRDNEMAMLKLDERLTTYWLRRFRTLYPPAPAPEEPVSNYPERLPSPLLVKNYTDITTASSKPNQRIMDLKQLSNFLASLGRDLPTSLNNAAGFVSQPAAAGSAGPLSAPSPQSASP